MTRCTRLLSLLAVLLPIPAFAQAAADTPAVISEFERCRVVGDDDRRLACFDAAAKRLADALDDKQITVLDREGVRSTRRSLFGFTLPRIGLFKSDNEQEDKEIESTVTAAVAAANGRYELVLADGARWQSTEPMRFPPRAGSKVKIRKAALGSYWIAIEGERTVRGRRIG